MSKYHNKPVEIDGYKFDSIAESRRYQELRLLQTAGDISGLVVHPRYVLQEAFKYGMGIERAITYIADFAYCCNSGWTVVEDVKGAKTEVYKIKRKLFIRKYPKFQFVEVTA